jgi:phosphoenolpyruvate---glycerone phosphotransferase subunit DhaL
LVLTTDQLHAAVKRIDASVAGIRDTLNAADRRFGDGDTGMTIEQVVIAWRALDMAKVADIGAAMVALGRETSRATGSSLGSVLAMGLRAAGRATLGHVTLDRAGLVTALAAAREAILAGSGAAIGDKTILDSITRIEEALGVAGDDANLHEIALRAAEDAVAEFRERESRIGRARMYGAKSADSDDPGMLAALLLLQAAR